ncbi:hypothetical protein [Altericista sp. CCNU0014]|uniref:hypothetical protein n=1 Tax=Altericista sp. CCNU0014 TaxID=3082949 RepID=UPI00384EC4BA
MTQENFLLKVANPEMQEQSFREFLEAQRELQEIWPWQASVEHWVDRILSFAEKPYLTKKPLRSAASKLISNRGLSWLDKD